MREKPFMEAEEVINLFDSSWFGQQILNQNSDIKPSSPPTPDQEFQKHSSNPKLFSQLTVQTRSLSDQMIMSSMASLITDSPNSVLLSPQKQTKSKSTIPEEPRTPQLKKKGKDHRLRRASSKSLSELEFEEVKGFMDLGFVFSEEDIQSSLVEIIPGLQRLGKEKEDDEEEEEKKSNNGVERKSTSVSRPYLSEAWKNNDYERRIKREEENPLMNWRIPSLGNEIDVKDSLKWWAHTVASTVR